MHSVQLQGARLSQFTSKYLREKSLLIVSFTQKTAWNFASKLGTENHPEPSSFSSWIMSKSLNWPADPCIYSLCWVYHPGVAGVIFISRVKRRGPKLKLLIFGQNILALLTGEAPRKILGGGSSPCLIHLPTKAICLLLSQEDQIAITAAHCCWSPQNTCCSSPSFVAGTPLFRQSIQITVI